MFIYGFLAVASLCASVAYRLAAWLVQEPTVIRIYRFNLFYINWILVRMLVRMLSPKGDPYKILLEARNSSAFFVRMLVRDFVLTIIRTKKNGRQAAIKKGEVVELLHFDLYVFLDEVLNIFRMIVRLCSTGVDVLKREVGKMILIFLRLYVEEDVAVKVDVLHRDVVGV